MRRTGLLTFAVVLLVLAAAGLWRAGTAAEPMTRAEQVEAVASTLRCPTCQGLSVADSPSTVADSMRDIITEQIDAGRSPDEVRAYFTARYGDWILLSPQPSGLGWLVWVLPIAAIALAVVAGVVVVRRQRHTGTLSAEQLRAAQDTLAAYRHAELAIPDTPAGERLESALALADSVAADEQGGLSADAAQGVALERVARALATRDDERQGERARPAAPSGAHRQARAARLGRRVREAVGGNGRRLGRAGGAAAFLIVLAGLLTANVAPRGADELATGNLPDRGEQASPDREDDGELSQLRAAVENDPADTRSRLVLAARLLQSGDAAAARAQAEAVLADDPEQLDARLVLALGQLEEGDPSAVSNLRQFLAAAPDQHPGVELAERLLERIDAGGDPDRR